MAHESSETISLDGAGRMRAFLALPEGTPPAGGWPGMLAIHDIAGFSRDIRRIARRLADSGYAALAPALFDGAGPPPLCVVRTFRDYQRREGPALARPADTLRTFKPSLAIATENLLDDVEVVPEIVLATVADYQATTGRCRTIRDGIIRPEVMYFSPPSTQTVAVNE